MFYRLAGVYRTSYAADRAILKIPADRSQVMALFAAALAAPFLVSNLYLSGYLLPWLIWSMAALSLESARGLGRANPSWLCGGDGNRRV